MVNPMTREQSLGAVPVAVSILEKVPSKNGGVRVTISVPTRPLQRKLLRLPEYVKREFELDPFGHEILLWCDGKNSVVDVLRLFSEKHGINPHEGEKAVLTFLRTLIAKGLVVLKVPA